MKKKQVAIYIAAVLASYGVTAQEENDVETIEIEGQYLSTEQANSIKTPTPIIDVPQSLSIFTDEEIKARGIVDIRGLVDYTPGINTSQGEGHRDAVVFRGNRSTADFYIDGNRDDVQYYRSLYNLEQVEILRGPNALLFGRGGTGGVINRVTKKAKIGEQFTQFQTGVDTFSGFTGQVDANFATSDSSSVRINAHYDSLENHRDFFDGDRFGFTATGRFELSTDTTLDLTYEYADHERFVDRGIPSDPNTLRPAEQLEDITFTDPDRSFTTLEANVFRAALEHRFSDTLKGNFSAFYGDYDKVYANFFPVSFDPTENLVGLDGYIDTTERQNLILSSNLVAEFSTGGIEHTLIFGGEYIDTESAQDRLNSVFASNDDDVALFSVARPIDFNNGSATVFTPQPDGSFLQEETVNTFSDLNDDTVTDIQVISFYVQDQIAISEQLDIVVGLRYDSFDIDELDIENGNELSSSDDDEISPRLGVIYKPRENVSLYASYSESFLPRSGEQFANIGATDGNNNPLDADEFENTEIGAKWDVNSSLSLTAAIFENQQNSAQVDGDDPSGANLIVVETQVTGFEFQASGSVNDFWSVSANYSYLDSEFGSQNPAVDGRRAREVPENTFSIWNSFDLSPNLGLGLGAIYQDESFTSNPSASTPDDQRVVLPSYVRVDLAGYYNISDNLRLQLNIENLLDRDYFPNSHTANNITVGAPINARFSLSGSF